MSFRFQVCSSNPHVVREAVEEVVHHFEESLNYKVEKVQHDSTRFPKEVTAQKKTRVEVKKEERGTVSTVSLVKFNEQQQEEEQYHKQEQFTLELERVPTLIVTMKRPTHWSCQI